VVPHDKAIEKMLQSHLLLLTTPKSGTATIPGKTFEYLASGRRIVCIGKGDSAKIIEEYTAGKSFERNEKEAIIRFLEEVLVDFENNGFSSTDLSKVEKFS